MHVLKKVGIAATAAALVASALSITLAGSASADTGARTGDVVGVGSDTIQNAADFLFDGQPGAAGGYNGQGNVNRVFNFFATGDANGRATYDGTCSAGQGTAPNASTGLGNFCDGAQDPGGAGVGPDLLPGTVVLRDGFSSVTRPNGSGAGVAALIADGRGGPGYDGLPLGSIQYARMSRLPNATEIGDCQAGNAVCGGLHVYQIATDQLQIAHEAVGYTGATTLDAVDLEFIYNCQGTGANGDATWAELPDHPVAGDNTPIDALIPQPGSGTRNFFLTDLDNFNGTQVFNGGNSVGACTRQVEEHDPTGIYADPSPANAIEPFSVGKIALINSGYFKNAGYKGTNFADGAYTPGFLTTIGGKSQPNATSKTSLYSSTRGLYIAIRQPDLASTTKFQPGGTQNWAQTLFAGPTSWVARATNAAAISAAGFTPAYKDCGVLAQSTC